MIFGDMAWAFCLFVVIGLATGAPALYLLWQGWLLETQGVSVQGQVKSVWQSSDSCGKDNMDTCTQSHVRYTYDAGGPLREATTTVGSGFYATLQTNGPIPVTYLRSDPAVNEVESGWTLFGGVLLLLFALAFAGAGGGAMWIRIRQVLLAEGQRDTGVSRQATVTDLQPTRFAVNGKNLWRITWRDETGAAGQSRAQAVGELPEIGAAVTVYADPAGKRPAVWEGDSGTR